MSQGHGARREALARPFAAGLLCPAFSRIQAALVMRDWGHVKCWRGAGRGGVRLAAGGLAVRSPKV